MNQRPGASTELDLRALRRFIVVADELHFTRAAARLAIAQQALSREIARLERDLGLTLFVRSTRRVSLTPAGERLLERARALLALHDRTIDELNRGPQPVVVNLNSPGRRTARRVLERARQAAPAVEFRGRDSSGFGEAVAELVAGEVDVAFGRMGVSQRGTIAGLDQQLIRYEPLALLLPRGHSLARRPSVPTVALRDVEIDAGLGNPKAPEWVDLATQWLAFSGARPTSPHLPAEGGEEQAHHLARQGLPILTSLDHVAVPGGELRAIVDPAPLYAWSMVWRTDADELSIRALLEAATHLAGHEGWLEQPRDSWLPQPESLLHDYLL
ncbi:MAG TPA: LysR family transcriptional regulator [Chloroflexota bacterium]